MAKQIDPDLLSRVAYCPNSPSGLIWTNPASRRVKAGDPVGSLLNGKYWVVTVKRKRVYLIHRVIWTLLYGPIPVGYEVDHRDTNKQNNTVSNLRLASNSQNKHNVGLTVRNSSGIKGIAWCKQTSMWRAQISLNGKSYSKRDPDLATLKVWLDNQRATLHGNFANRG